MVQPIDIQIRRSLTNTPSSLLYGEPAWDDTNEQLYIGNSVGASILINPTPTNSLDITLGNLQLINDVANPGSNTYYGTNASGTKGFYSFSGSTVANLSLGTITSTQIPLNIDTGSDVIFPAATSTLAGLLTASAQTIGGLKTFNNGATVQVQSAINPFTVIRNGGTTSLVVENDGTITAGTTSDYASLVTATNDIVNKGYLDNQLALITLASAKARRTTSFVFPGSWTNLSFNVTDIETSPSVINHTDTNFVIGVTGLYVVAFAGNAIGEGQVRFAINGTAVAGHIAESDRTTDIIPIPTTAILNISAGDTLTVQLQSTGAGTNTLQAGATLSIYKLDGLPGSQGAQGPAGVAGTAGATGFGIYAWATTTAGAVISEGLGLSVASGGTGIYNYTFTTPTSTNTYAVLSQAIGQNQNDIEAEVYNKTTTGFTIRTNSQDDGGGLGSNTNFDHSVVILGPNNGGPVGISSITFKNNNINVIGTPHSTANFSNRFNLTNAGSGQVNIELAAPSIFKVISAPADQATNYNIKGPEVALVLTGSSTILGTASTDFTNSNGTITCNFTGSIKISYSVPHISAGTRASLKSIIQLNTGSGFINVGGDDYSYIRNGNGEDRDTNSNSNIFTCNSGDQFRIGMRRSENSTQGAAINLLPNTYIIIERIN